MNRIYRVIWNSSLLTWVAVSELAKSNKRSKSVNAINILSLSLIIFTVEGHSATVVPTTGSGCANGSTGTIVEKPVQRAPNSPVTDGSGAFSLVVGCGASGGGFGSVTAIGTAATTTGNAALAVGTNAQASDNSVALGSDAWAVGSRSIALGIGADTSAAGSDSIAFGYQSNTTGSKSIAIGSLANATVANSIALGADTTTTAATGASFLTNNAASTVTGVVSVGSASQTRRIQNVADGSAASDAVTVAQLNKSYDDTNGRLAAALGTGSGAAYNATTDTYTAPINIGGTGKSTIDDAIKATQRSVVAGSNIVVTPTTAADGSISYSVSTSTTPIFNSVTVNNTPTAGTDATNKTYVDAKAAAAKTEVIGGTNVTNVVKTTGTNGQDIYTVNANGTTASAGSSAVTVTAGTKDANNVTDYKVDLAANTKTDIQKGVDAKTAVDNTGLTFKGDTAATSATKKLGDTVSITGDTNISTVATTDGVQVKLNPNLDLGAAGSVITGNSKLDNSGLTITGGPSFTSSGINAANKNISNVADATTDDQAVNKGQLDAATTASSSKTDALGNSTATNLGGGSKYDNSTGAISAPSYVTTKTDGTTTTANNVGDALTNLNTEVVKPVTFTGNSGTVDRKLGETLNITGGLTGAGSNSNIKTVITGNTLDIQLADAPIFAGKVTANGLDANGNKVENVADAIAASDAVNKGQLDAATTASSSKTDTLGNSTATNLGGGSKYDNSTGAISAPSYVTTKTDGTTTTANNVGDALTNLNTEVVKPVTFTGNSGTVDRKLGETLNITGGLTGAGSNSNIKTVITGNTLDIQLADAPVFAGKVTANGLDANGNKVENVADATTATDAVNKGQLDAATTASSTKTDTLGTSTATNLGGGSTYDNTTGAISAPSYVTTKTDGTTTTANNVGDALSNLNTEVIKPVTFTGNSGTVDRKLGETLNITGGLTGAGSNSNIKTVITGNTLDIQLADAPVFAGKVTANGLDANGNKVENVADATAASDAVNKGQLDSLSADLTNTGFGLKAADGNTVNKKLGEAVEVVGADSNITTRIINGQVAIELNKNLNNLTGITVNDGTNGTNGSTVIGKDGLSVKDGSGNTIVGLDNTALTIKDGSGNTETSINKAINTLNASQGETDKFAVKYDKSANGSANYDSVTLAGTSGTTITNVKSGAINSVSTDAINGSQLYGVADSVKNVIGGSTTIDSTTGAIIANNIGGTGFNTLDGAISSIKDSTTKAKTTVTAGENVVVTSSTNADGSDNYEVSTAKDLIVDSVKAGDTVLNNAGITIGHNTVVLNNAGLTINGGPSVTAAGIDAGNKTIQNVANAVNTTDAVNKGQLDSAISNVNNNVNELANNVIKYDDASKDKITLGGGANGTTITNVKDGTVAQGSKDAVNGGQLWNVQQQVDQNTTDISNIKNDINSGTVGLVQQAGKDATVTVAKDTGGTSVSVAGTDGNRVVTGVKEGAVNATSKDAVNGSQLNTTNQAVVNYLGGGAGYDNITGSLTAPSYTVGDSKYNNVGGAIDALNQADQALNSKIDNVSNKLDNAFRITNNRIDDVEKKANAGIAAAMALESAPYIPGKYTYAAGAAYHGGENAVGVTLRKTADNGRWSITGGVAAASQGDPSVRIGISGVID
ncbi:YadA-like family protein [Acinetobacter bereziniae]|nr:ESPR-type extended signal peptide-containing protein [Acinetobacter bereziniae]MBJ9947580.1 YadA-like family protein [Acinetobacter bereziniae]